MKKFIVYVLTLAMTFSLLTGCGGTGGKTSTPDEQNKGDEKSGTDDNAGKPVTLDLVTAAIGTSWYTYGATLSEVMAKGLPKGSVINAVAEGGATSNPIQVSDGKYELGIAYNMSAKWAYNGESLYKEKLDKLRSLAGYLDTFYYIAVVRKDAGWTDLAEVAEKHLPIKISVLPSGNMGNVVMSMILEYYGMTFDDIISWGGTVEFAPWTTSVENIKDGRTDFVCHNITQGHAAVTELSSTVDMNFIQFDDDMIKYFIEKLGFSPEVLPAGCFKGQDKEIKTFGVTSNLICSADMSDDVAYGLTKALCENAADVNAGHKALQRFSPETAADPAGLGIPLHPGAEKYYKEKGLIK